MSSSCNHIHIIPHSIYNNNNNNNNKMLTSVLPPSVVGLEGQEVVGCGAYSDSNPYSISESENNNDTNYTVTDHNPASDNYSIADPYAPSSTSRLSSLATYTFPVIPPLPLGNLNNNIHEAQTDESGGYGITNHEEENNYTVSQDAGLTVDEGEGKNYSTPAPADDPVLASFLLRSKRRGSLTASARAPPIPKRRASVCTAAIPGFGLGLSPFSMSSYYAATAAGVPPPAGIRSVLRKSRGSGVSIPSSLASFSFPAPADDRMEVEPRNTEADSMEDSEIRLDGEECKIDDRSGDDDEDAEQEEEMFYPYIDGVAVDEASMYEDYELSFEMNPSTGSPAMIMRGRRGSLAGGSGVNPISDVKGFDIIRGAPTSPPSASPNSSPAIAHNPMYSTNGGLTSPRGTTAVASPLLLAMLNVDAWGHYRQRRSAWNTASISLSPRQLLGLGSVPSTPSAPSPSPTTSFNDNLHRAINDMMALKGNLNAFDWNAELQSLMESWQQEYDQPTPNPDVLLDIAEALQFLSSTFVSESSRIAKEIVLEGHLPDQFRKVKVSKQLGGFAGGVKYREGNIIFKLASSDPFGIYTDVRFAAKSARHELMGLNALQLGRMLYHDEDASIWKTGKSPYPCFPLCCLVSYGGHTLLALSKVPIEGTSTILFGSSDGGETIHNKSNWTLRRRGSVCDDDETVAAYIRERLANNSSALDERQLQDETAQEMVQNVIRRLRLKGHIVCSKPHSKTSVAPVIPAADATPTATTTAPTTTTVSAAVSTPGSSSTETRQMFTFGPADMEVHRGTDGRYYIIDPARLFPPLKPKESATRSGQNLYRHFRPEFFVSTSWRKSLSSDAYSKFQSSDEERRNNLDVQEATVFLLRKVLPDFSREMDRFYRALYAPNYSFAPLTGISDEEFQQLLNNPPDVVIDFNSMMASRFLVQMHLRGINAEFLGRVYYEAKFVPLKRFVLLEMLARTMKNDMKSWLRRQSETRLKGMICGMRDHEGEMKKWVAERLSHYFQPGSEEHEIVWQRFRQELKLSILHWNADEDPIFQQVLNNPEDVFRVFLRLQDLVGLRIRPEAFYGFPGRPCEPSDVLELLPRVKAPYSFSYVLGYALFEKGQGERSRSEAQSLFLRASEHYERALSSYPGDWIAFCNHSASLTRLALLEGNSGKGRELLIWADLQAHHAFRLNRNAARTLTNWGVVLKAMSVLFPEHSEKLCDLSILKLCAALDLDFHDCTAHENMGLVLAHKGMLVSNSSLKDLIFQESRWHFEHALTEAQNKVAIASIQENLSAVTLRYAYTLRRDVVTRYDQILRLCHEVQQRLLSIDASERTPLILHNLGESYMLEAGIQDVQRDRSDDGTNASGGPHILRLLHEAAKYFERCVSSSTDCESVWANQAKEKLRKLKALLAR